ncbi:hypothetical protein [Caballeronia sp. RCC_10]|uniref:hypothetical protein n=1 Tax=Caballeronia sp. RCC_10 TaxID=3239227 RepID=UPI003523C724
MTQTSSALANPMDWLFGQLHGMFGNKLLDGFRSGHVIDGKDTGVENMKAIWAEKIRANGLKFADVKRGLAGAERLKWPPTWGEFLDLCKPAIDVDAALYEAIDQMRARQQGKDEWSHPAIFWAAARVGEFDMLGQNFAALKPRFETALNAVLKGGNVQPVPPRVPKLQAPGGAESTREFGRQRLDELGASEIIKTVSMGGNLNWAHRIIAEEKATGKVPLNKLNIARQAVFNVTGKQP